MLDGTGIPGEPGMADLAALEPHALDQTIAQFQAAFTWWRQVPAVTVAAVAGHAVGAGFQLALGCDLVVCADDARFAMRETSLGLVPDLGGTARLVEAVGYPRALEICATGRWVGAREAVDLGLAIAAVPEDELEAAVDDLVAALLSAPAGALRETKGLLRAAVHRDADEQLAAERAAQARCLAELANALRP
jgi:enoyl-CoA hydratase/carnithine racemase